jgi:hypothetical protein
VVGTPAVAAAAPGQEGVRGVTATGLVAGGTLHTERRGGAAVTTEGGVRSQNGRAGGGALFLAPILPDIVAPLDKGLRFLELMRVDQVSDVAWQFAEEKDRLDLLHCGPLQMVPNGGGPVVAATRMV